MATSMIFGGRPSTSAVSMLLPCSGPSLSFAVIVGPLSAGLELLVDARARVAVRECSSALGGGGRRARDLTVEAAALVDPALGVQARLVGRSSGKHFQRGPGGVF
jgi:hypothetical protein